MKGRVLAIDYGTKRIGLAICDALRVTTRPFGVLTRERLDLDLARLAKIAEEEGIEEIVIGLPRNADGSSGPMVAVVEEFAAALEKEVPMRLHFMDETYSSLEADEVLRRRFRDPKKRKEMRDAYAAVVILQAWLDHYGR
ncbi:MAG: Holliday junction resolvase RuvX [Planctomycetota bacterium]